MADKNVQQFLGNVKIDGAAEVNTIELSTSDTGDGTKGLVSPRADNPTKFDSLSLYNGSLYITENKSSPKATDGQRKLVFPSYKAAFITQYEIFDTQARWDAYVCLIGGTMSGPGPGSSSGPFITFEDFIEYLTSPNVSILSATGLRLEDVNMSTIVSLSVSGSNLLVKYMSRGLGGLSIVLSSFITDQTQCRIKWQSSRYIQL